MDEYGKILFEIQSLKGAISAIEKNSKTIEGWLPRKSVMKFFDIGDTTMAAYEKSGKLIVSTVGRRKFYCVKSIVELLKSNIVRE